MLRFPRPHETSRSGALFGVILTVSLLLQFPGGALGYLHNSTYPECKRNGWSVPQGVATGGRTGRSIHPFAITREKCVSSATSRAPELQLRTFQRHQLYARLSTRS